MGGSRLAQHIAEMRKRNREAISSFIAAITNDDIEALISVLDRVEGEMALVPAFRAVGRLQHVSARMQRTWRSLWCSWGDDLRSDINDDLVLATALRRLLPPYRGPDLVLFRGDSAWNRQRRTYGLSWSREEGVADDFARSSWRTIQGGSVLLRAVVPADAIICTVPSANDRYGEKEVLVDRRGLGRVTALRRYTELSPHAFMQQQSHG